MKRKPLSNKNSRLVGPGATYKIGGVARKFLGSSLETALLY